MPSLSWNKRIRSSVVHERRVVEYGMGQLAIIPGFDFARKSYRYNCVSTPRAATAATYFPDGERTGSTMTPAPVSRAVRFPEDKLCSSSSELPVHVECTKTAVDLDPFGVTLH